MKITLFFTLFFLSIVPITLHAQKLEIYDLEKAVNNNKDSVAFTSFSVKYFLSDHPDSLAIPDLEGKLKDLENELFGNSKEESIQHVEDSFIKNAEYIILSSKYRKRFLDKTKILETDKVFIYNYATNVLISFPVSNLNVVACLDGIDDSWPYSQNEYMIGFEIQRKFLKVIWNYLGESFVYVGKTSPFVVGQLKAVVWKKIDNNEFSLLPISPNDTLILNDHKCTAGNAYRYDANGLQYFVQEFSRSDWIFGSDWIFARRLIVISSKTKKIVCKRIYLDNESESAAPLNFVGTDSHIYQWTGKLFKNKPSVIFGIQYSSRITFLNQPDRDIYVNSDNRD